MKKIIKIFIPRIVITKEEKNDASVVFTNQVENNLARKAALWWKNDEYTKVKKLKQLKWLGITLFKFPFYETIEDNYFKPANDIVKLVKEMQKPGICPPLNENSIIFEPGCSVGRNLYYLQEEFNCNVVGMDISQEAIKLAEGKIWRKRKKYQFYTDDVLTTDFFDKLDDKIFDLVITRWHLIHIPRSEKKRNYIEALKRISKTLVILEPVKEGVSEVQFYMGGEYCLSWDDWVSEYDLIEFNAPIVGQLEPRNTRVFFKKNE